jgi:hypothetical protein
LQGSESGRVVTIEPSPCETDIVDVLFSHSISPANNLRRISTMYVRGYLQGIENGRVVTIGGRLGFQLSVKLYTASPHARDHYMA